MRTFLVFAALAFVLSAFFQGGPKNANPSPWRPRPCENPCSNCRIDSMEREYRWGRATQNQYETFRNDELARIKSAKCDTTHFDEGDWCPARDLNFREVSGEWAFWEEAYVENQGNCQKVPGSDQLRFKVTAPEKTVSGKAPFIFLMGVGGESIMPLEDKFHDWQAKEFDVELPDDCASIDCFHCQIPEHNIRKDPGICAPLREFLEKIERIKKSPHKFSAIVPGLSHTWLVSQDKTLKKVPALESGWFTGDFMKAQFGNEKSRPWIQCLRNLAQIAAADVNLVIVSKNIKACKFVVRAQIEGLTFEFGVSSGEYYFPVNPGAFSLPMIRKLASTLSSNRQNQALLQKLLVEWMEDKNESEIVDFIPHAWTRTDNPMDAVGNQTTEPGIGEALAGALTGTAALDILLRTGEGTHQVWRSGSNQPETSAELENSFNSGNRFVRLLALADPNLKILAENTAGGKLVFFYKANTQTVWSWIRPPQAALQQFRLLKGENAMLYSGASIHSYNERLFKSISDREKSFLLDFSDSPDRFQLVDWYAWSDMAHVALYKKADDGADDPNAQKIHRMSNLNGPDLQAVLFRTVDVNWPDMPAAYTGWKRKALAETVYGDAGIEDVEIWISPAGMGFSRKEGFKLLDVYTAENCRYVRIPLTKIESRINAALYVGDNFPDIHQLFHDWLSLPWNKKNWRANPRGLLARE